MKIILGSQSLIRQRALKLLDLPFEIAHSNINEKAIRHTDPYQMAINIAEAKAKAIGEKHEGIIICGDAFMVFNGKIVEKPSSVAEAKQMIRSFSGKSYDFVTSVVVYNTKTNSLDKAAESLTIWFRELTDAEIDNYVAKYPVTTLAGGHETDGAILFSSRIEGNYNSYTAIPMNHLIPFLRKNGVKV
jgi:septum formation protein